MFPRDLLWLIACTHIVLVFAPRSSPPHDTQDLRAAIRRGEPLLTCGLSTIAAVDLSLCASAEEPLAPTPPPPSSWLDAATIGHHVGKAAGQIGQQISQQLGLQHGHSSGGRPAAVADPRDEMAMLPTPPAEDSPAPSAPRSPKLASPSAPPSAPAAQGADAKGAACYLLSQDRLLRSYRSLDCLGLPYRSGLPGPESDPEPLLPAFPAWGLLSPACWKYVRVKRRNPMRAPTVVAEKQLSEEASQEWQHPERLRRRRGSLRVVVRGECLPFLLDDLPHKLSQGRMRRDALATTITKHGRRGVEERRVSMVERVVVDSGEAVESALRYAREVHPHALNPLVTSEASEREGGSVNSGGWHGFFGLGANPENALGSLRDRPVAMLLARQQLRRLRRGTLFLSINAVAIIINIVVAARAIVLWRVVENNRVVEWIQRAAPHAETTIVAVKWINLATRPIRQAVRGVGIGLRAGFSRLRTVERGGPSLGAGQPGRGWSWWGGSRLGDCGTPTRAGASASRASASRSAPARISWGWGGRSSA
jgi:hypothetical protein